MTRRFTRRALVRIAGLPARVMMLLCLLSGAAVADQFLPLGGGWQTYINDRFGMRFDYPADLFTPAAPPENGDGRSFEAPEAALYMFASHNTAGDTPASFKRQLIGSENYEHVTYSPSGESWLVISGFRGRQIFYEKYFFNDGVISAFGMEFPADKKPHYAPMVERIEDSFRAGRSD